MADLTFVMIDLAGFTALAETHGDEEAANVAVALAAVAESCMDTSDRLVKTMGDAVLLTAADPLAGIGLVQRILASCREREQFLVTRTGMHHGPAVERGGDYFGQAVNLTARLAAHAAPGQVLGTDRIAEAARAAGISVEALGELKFKNVAEATPVHALLLGPAPSLMTVDPVCRMLVDVHTAAGFLRHDGQEHWFCSVACLIRYAEVLPSS